MKKPHWLHKKIDLSSLRRVKELLSELNLHTVCQQALCPNISECFKNNVATFMILGTSCSRNCGFCAIEKLPLNKPDYTEPHRVKEAVKRMGLKYVVVTSPARDDLVDGGAKMFLLTVKEIKALVPVPKVEILIPDFEGKEKPLELVASSGADIISHNIETVPSLYIKVRKEADYIRSLDIIKKLKGINKNIIVKSGFMLGIGEEKQEVIDVLGDLANAGCDFLTIGQYLAPTTKHYPVIRYIPQEEFLFYKEKAFESGFKAVKAAPYVRSSYLAHTLL
ncbi:MAG: lipoyl synthase [Candidatus Omnitrophota bacterium]